MREYLTPEPQPRKAVKFVAWGRVFHTFWMQACGKLRHVAFTTLRYRLDDMQFLVLLQMSNKAHRYNMDINVMIYTYGQYTEYGSFEHNQGLQ